MHRFPAITGLWLVLIAPLATPSAWAQTDDATAIGPEAFEVLRLFFAYDPGIPLEARVVDQRDAAGYARDKVVFRGAKGGRVPAYLAVPEGAGPHPCVVLMHGIGSSKEDWWRDDSFPSGGHLSRQLLDSGFAVMTVDAEYHGERSINNDFESPMVFTFQHGWILRARDMIVQSVVEHRRAIDYLATRDDIDLSRLGVVGYSMGGIMAFALSALEPRIQASVAAVTPILEEAYSAIAVQNLAPYATRPPFLMLVGEEDHRNYSPEAARRIHALLASPEKELVFYPSGHKLPQEWTEAATEWMRTHLQ